MSSQPPFGSLGQQVNGSTQRKLSPGTVTSIPCLTSLVHSAWKPGNMAMRDPSSSSSISAANGVSSQPPAGTSNGAFARVPPYSFATAGNGAMGGSFSIRGAANNGAPVDTNSQNMPLGEGFAIGGGAFSVHGAAMPFNVAQQPASRGFGIKTTPGLQAQPAPGGNHTGMDAFGTAFFQQQRSAPFNTPGSSPTAVDEDFDMGNCETSVRTKKILRPAKDAPRPCCVAKRPKSLLGCSPVKYDAKYARVSSPIDSP
jgi:hypothetical protein